MTLSDSRKVGNKKLYRNNALDIMRVPFNPKFKDVPDEELVEMAQKEVDQYRSVCKWECSCGHELPYETSLIIMKEIYIHEIRCCDLFKKTGCKNSMFLIHSENKTFNASCFEELFARYQDRIIAEASKSSFNEDAYDTYAALCSFFPKVVAKFAREKSFFKKSENWFSSYFWISVKNKATDIKKARFYVKRSPSVICEVCRKSVGGINVKHLMSKGHEVIRDKFYERIGNQIIKVQDFYLSDLSEKERKSIKKQATTLGRKSFKAIKKEDKKKLINNEYISIYVEMFPESTINNFVLSTNELVGEEGNNEVEYGDMLSNKHRVGYNENNELELKDMAKSIVDRIIEPNISNFEKLFRKGVDHGNKIRIITDIIFNKSSYNNIDNKELDEDHEDFVKRGLSSAIFDFIAKSNVVEEIIH